MTSIKIVQFSRPPYPVLSIYIQNSSTPLTLDVQFQTNLPPNFKRKPHYLLFCGFILLCVQLSKNITKCLFCLYFTHILSTHILQSTSFICTTWKRKQTMKKQPYRTSERTKSKQKRNKVMSHSNWPRVLLFGLAHKQCSGINKGLPDVRVKRKISCQ